jgi:prepilin-type N-terminal cleavage/methylation domain-containing protein
VTVKRPNLAVEVKRVRAGAFTLMEMMTVLVIIALLMVLFLPLMGNFRGRAERLACTTNLRSLQSAAANYTIDNQHWPQIPMKLKETEAYAEAWHAALKPYNIDWTNWVCPSVQRNANHPDLSKKKNQRLDYFATPFDNHPRTPWRWATQPWFIERGDVHGAGNLMVFRDGTIEDLHTVSRRVSMQGGTLD